MAVKCILTGQEKVNLSGDTMTGDLKVGSSSIGTNGYIEGTWLKTTKATESAGDFATISGDGWIYKRKPTDVLGDIGGQVKITASGLLKGNGNGGVTAAVAGKDYDTEIVYVNYTGDTPTKDNITNMTEVVAAYNAGKVIAIMAVANHDTSASSKVPFFLTQAINNNGAIYAFYFIADYVSGTGDNTAISCPYCIQIQCSQTQTSNGYIYNVSSVTDYGLTKAFPAAHADTHKTGGDDSIAPSDIGAQPKITANGVLKGDGAGNITAADETEVELVDLPQEVFWAIYGETTAAEIEEAWQASKLIVLVAQFHYYILGTRTTSKIWSFYNFVPGTNGSFKLIVLNNGAWSGPDIVGYVCDKKDSLSLPTTSWTGSDPYTQAVTIPSPTVNTKVDIQPSEELYDQLVADNVGYLAIKNVDGTLTAVAKGGKPSVDLTVQVTYNNVY